MSNPSILDPELWQRLDTVVGPNAQGIGKPHRPALGQLLGQALRMIGRPMVNVGMGNANVLDRDNHIRHEQNLGCLHVIEEAGSPTKDDRYRQNGPPVSCRFRLQGEPV